MPGRYYPSSHRHGGGGSNQRPGNGIPTNINIGPDNSSSSNAGASNNNNPSHPHSVLSPESVSLAHLRQKSISHPMQQCQLTIYVPPHTVGAVIGRGGRTILNVQREAMRRSAGHVAPVRISVLGSNSSNSSSNNSSQVNPNSSTANANGHANMQQNEGVTDHQGDAFTPHSQQGGGQSSSTTWNYHEYLNQQQQQNQPSDNNNIDNGTTTDQESKNDDTNSWTPVIIRGDPVGCYAAVRQILPLVDYSHDRHVVLEIPVHRAKHNTLVGKGGITIAALSATYETRIMIPPNEFMSNVGGMGGENFWKRRQQAADDQNDASNAGAVMLFGDPGGGGANGKQQQQQPGGPGTLPPNIIQLEGEIDTTERCLVKMLSIVAGERWVPTGTIVEKAAVAAVAGGSRGGAAPNVASDGGASSVPSGGASGGASGGKVSKEGATTAESVIVKIWTPSSKLLNLGKIRKVQRKTNTVIRRKKLRLSGNHNVDSNGVVIGALMNEKEEDVVDDEGVDGPPMLVNEGEDDEDGGVPKEVSFAGPKTATKYIITGKTEAVRSATAQFEKILGLEPGSSAIVDTTHKTMNSSTTSTGANKDAPNATQQVGGTKSEPGDSEIGGGGPGGKKMRRKKKRGGKGERGNQNTPKGYKDGPPTMVVVERGDV